MGQIGAGMVVPIWKLKKIFQNNKPLSSLHWGTSNHTEGTRDHNTKFPNESQHSDRLLILSKTNQQ